VCHDKTSKGELLAAKIMMPTSAPYQFESLIMIMIME
jgi:hypothetical protein